MEKRPDNERSKTQKTKAEGSTKVGERRSSARKSFITEAVVVEVNSGARIPGRCSDLVKNGCYVDTLNPFMEGTIVHLHLKHGDSKLEAKGRVVYQVASMGMGIEFHELTPENRKTLDEWLSQTSGDRAASGNAPPAPRTAPSAIHGEAENKIVQLIYILRMKGILTNAEVALLLKETLE